MSSVRRGTAGATRTCPHCKATILDSAGVCPACRGHLRFETSVVRQPDLTPLQVEGTIRHPADGGAWEYSVVLSIRDDRGEEINRQVVGVGALRPDEQRTFSLAVEVFATTGTKTPNPH
jgi:hypothetical protein